MEIDMEKERKVFLKSTKLWKSLQPQIGRWMDVNRQIIIDSKKLKPRWKEHTEILFSKYISIQNTFEDIAYIQEPLVLGEVRVTLQSLSIQKAIGTEKMSTEKCNQQKNNQ